MIAITPMPPTINAIDEITTSARRHSLRELVEDPHQHVGGQHVEVVFLIDLQAVPAAHDLLDLGLQLLRDIPS